MSVLIAILTSLLRGTVDVAKQIAIAMRQMFGWFLLSMKEWLVFATLRRAVLVLFWASVATAAVALLHELAGWTVGTIGDTLLSTLLPSSGNAQFVSFAVWDSGVSLKYCMTLVVDWLALYWAVSRAVAVFDYVAAFRVRVAHMALSWYRK